MAGMGFYRIEPCFLCDSKGELEVNEVDFYGHPQRVQCPCCGGNGELRVYGGEKPNE